VFCAAGKKLKNKKCAVAKNKTSLRWLSDRAVMSVRFGFKKCSFIARQFDGSSVPIGLHITYLYPLLYIANNTFFGRIGATR